MGSQQLQDRISQVLKLNRIGVLSTVREGRPYARYMTFSHEGFTLYTPTAEDTHKVEDIEENSHVHILLGYEEGDDGDAFVEIEATVQITNHPDEKKKAWSEKLASKYVDADDERFIVLVCHPTLIRYHDESDPSQSEELRF